MKKAWNLINSFKVTKDTKNSLFIGSQVIFYALIGAAVWGILGRLVLPGLNWFLCFVGYPATFIGFLGSVLYLYRNEFV